MDTDRVKGSLKQGRHRVKEAADNLTAIPPLNANGKADKTAGKFLNAAGVLNDNIRYSLG